MRAIFIIFVLAVPCIAQSGILTSTRYPFDNWHGGGLPATFPDGETTANPWTPPSGRTQCVNAACATVTSAAGSSTAAQINAAIAGAPAQTYVLLPPGVYGPYSTNIVVRTSDVDLRGSGGNSTFVSFTGTANFQFGVCCGTSFGVLSATSYASGTTSITLTGATGNPANNQVVEIQQCNTGFSGSGLNGNGDVSCTSGSYSDPGTIWICGIDVSACSNDTPHSGADNFQHQLAIVTNTPSGCTVSCTVTFSPGLYMPNWGSGNTALMIWQSVGNTTIGTGVSDLSVTFAFNTTEKFDFESCYGCWIKGNRIIGDGTNIRLALGGHSAQNLVSNNLLFGENPNNLASGISEPFTRSDDSTTMILNNIIEGGICVWGDESEVGEVIAYNFCRDVQTPYSSLQTYLNHNPTEAFTLFEGNDGINPHADSTHGTNNLVTDFRNYAPGWDVPYHSTTGASWAIEQDSYQRFYNYVGNALGGAESLVYKSAATNAGAIIVTPADALTGAGYMLWGNCDVVNANCRFQSSEVPNSTNMPAGTYPNATAYQNATPGNNNLPCSFFLTGSAFTTSPCAIQNGGTGLSWWKVCKTWNTFPSSCATTQTQSFPPVGPDQSGGPYVNGHAYDNAAALADINEPVDTTLQTAFTITASSWSNNTTTCALNGSPTSLTTAPCEILTVSLASINNGSAQHIMGRFQFGAGINAACKTGAISNGNNGANDEIYIVNSTTTQIAYSLGSSSPDNGSSNQCTGGTFRFPDVRQHDERVFQADTTSTPIPPAPAPWVFAKAVQ